MMNKYTSYVAKKPDTNGFIKYNQEENTIWAALVKQQMDILPGRACNEFMHGLATLNLCEDKIPQLDEINKILQKTTGWKVTGVPALISFDRFFKLLANKEFPVATFIRRKDEFKYIEEPDIFHEIFGHCPLLTNPSFAKFTHTYGQLGYAASKEDRVYLARLYWMTVEFGLIQSKEGLRIYGGGILSSPGETIHALESKKAIRHLFDPVVALRTPYRIDIMQPVYYIIESLYELEELSKKNIMQMVEEAKAKGMHKPLFPPKNKQTSYVSSDQSNLSEQERI